MPISSKEVTSLIALTSVIFFIAPLFLIIYVVQYNRKKKKHVEEKILLQKTFENELLKTQIEVQEQTLKTIAYDLHDNIGQLLSLTTITLSSVNIEDREKTANKITLADDLVKRSVKEVKALARMLHSEELVSRGIAAAIEFELEWLKRSERFVIHFDKTGHKPFNNDTAIETILFRLFQEIINNIMQHAQATEIYITLDHQEDDFRLTIRDNGIGFNVDEVMNRKMGMGLQNIVKRSAMIHGTATISSTPQGSTFIITAPQQ